jgi:hypothetical protein
MIDRIKPYPLSHPTGASDKVRQLTRIRVRGGLRVEYYNETTEADIMKKGRRVAVLRKEELLGLQPKQIWVLYRGGKRMGSAELHKVRDLLKQIAQVI